MEQVTNPLATSFAPVAFMIFMSVMTGIGVVVLSTLLNGRRKSAAGETIYECGLDPMDESHKRFSVDFYIVAMLFILFDVEVALLIPWAIYFTGVADTADLRLVAFLDFLVFVAILGVGYIYLYRAGAFDWSEAVKRGRRLDAAREGQQR